MGTLTKALILLAMSFTFESCSFFVPDPTIVHILPIVFNVDEQRMNNNTYSYPDKAALKEAKKLYEETFNLKFHILDSVYTTDPLQFTCDEWEPPPIIDIENTDIINQCYQRLIMVVYVHRNMSTNLLGCAPFEGILNGTATLFLYLEDDTKSNVEVLEHELAHIFGAEHTEDGTLMSPAQNDMTSATFSDETKDQINKLLDRLNNSNNS
jgi:hypothetical protein